MQLSQHQPREATDLRARLLAALALVVGVVVLLFFITEATGASHLIAGSPSEPTPSTLPQVCIDGATGPSGPAGVSGATGQQGDTGVSGPQGNSGAGGPAGSTGTSGATGPKGGTGVTGPKGITGATGAKGVTGPKGATGTCGPTGPKGDTGAAGISHSLIVKDHDGATLGAYVTGDEYIVVLGSDGHYRRYRSSDGAYSVSPVGPYYQSADCTGNAYSPAGSRTTPFPGMPVRLNGGFASLSTAGADAVDSATLQSKGTPSSCDSYSAAAGTTYQRWISPAYSVGNAAGPLSVQEG